MSWIKITDDPNTLPPMETPVFVIIQNGDGMAMQRFSTFNGWHWEVCDYAPYTEEWTDHKWTCGGSTITRIEPVAWHPFPELPTEAKP
ncbi:MAG TPA: hypothetical protein VLA24_05455 [Pseudomonadales bacterium]|nr:hypothetical protein [Pseudomonadales bacterium]